MESLPEFVYFKDLDGRFLAVNHAHAASLGLAGPELAVGKTDYNFFEPSVARQKFADEAEVIRTGLGFVGKEEPAHSNTGQRHWVMTSKQPLFGDSGKIVGTFGISRDITEIKVAREALEAHHRLLETLIDILPCRIFIKDHAGRLKLTNMAYRDAAGAKSAAEIEGGSSDELIDNPRAEQVIAEDRRILEEGLSVLNREDYNQSPLDDHRWMLLSKVPLRDADGAIQGIVGMAADITAQKDAEARALKTQRELEARNLQMAAELSVARELQTELMAFSIQAVREELASTSLALGFHYEPCAFLAGDFFHAVPYSKSCFGLLLCDVMGHGVKAALVTTLIRGLLSDVRSKNVGPAQVLEHLNERLCPLLDRPPLPRFVTALYGRVDLARGIVDFASGGHHWPLLQRPGRKSVPVTTEQCGPALGLIRGARYTSSICRFTSGDRVLLFTDGWLEEANHSGEEFGVGRLVEGIDHRRQTPVDQVLSEVAQEISVFSGRTDRNDDLCAVLVGAG